MSPSSSVVITLSTIFSGAISTQVAGTHAALVKTGSGTLMLSNENFYIGGGTYIESGTLLVNNATGSGTGFERVRVDGGTLGGIGTIDGAVVVGNGAAQEPGQAGTVSALLTIHKS